MNRVFTPITRYTALSAFLGVDLRVKHDDLYPVVGRFDLGGNKARKLVPIIAKAESEGANALVTTGGTQSNHARVVAGIAAEKGWRCILVLHGKPSALTKPKGNLLLMKLAGADVRIVEPSAIGETMKAAMEELRKSGYIPYEIPGGGHCLEGALPYVDAVTELKEQLAPECWQPDWIILASGTGTTQAGIVVGVERVGWETRVVGISVARRNPFGKKIVEESCNKLRQHFGVEAHIKIDFRDEWTCGGYEKVDEKVLNVIQEVAPKGLLLDPTYTGKAFTGLIDLVQSGEIPAGSRVLFWHTGGLMNLLASKDIACLLRGR